MKIDLDMAGFATSLRFAVVTVLMAVLMLPLALVSCVVDDRQQYYFQAIDGISQAWGREQRIAGPLLLIPLVPAADKFDTGEHIVVMPATFDARLASSHEPRRRGIFEAPVFHAEVVAEGQFPPLDEAALTAQFGELRFDRAAIAIGISDARGIRVANLRWRDAPLELNAGTGFAPLEPGLRAPLATPLDGGTFALTLELRGSKRFSVVPVGERSQVSMTSTWPHPSFDGRFLPDQHDVRDDGFSASWTTLGLARGLPRIGQVSADQGPLFANKDMGFSVFEPVNLYASAQRSIKYGVLFVVLTLAAVLCLELSTGVRFHVVQYGVAGVALVLFFLTLLALAEHIGFAFGYAVAAALLTTMITWYAHGTKGDSRLTMLAAGLLAALYAVLYVLLRLESFALLVGTGVLLLALTMLMRATRRLPAPNASSPIAPKDAPSGGQSAASEQPP